MCSEQHENIKMIQSIPSEDFLFTGDVSNGDAVEALRSTACVSTAHGPDMQHSSAGKEILSSIHRRL